MSDLIACIACLLMSAVALIDVFFLAARSERALRDIAREEAEASFARHLSLIAENDVETLARRATFTAALFNRSPGTSL